MLATTVYANPSASYTFSIACSRQALQEAGLPTAYLLLSGNCHVDDARNSVVRDFLNSDCTDLVFLDADVSWEPSHLIELCGYDCDLVGGVYPYRRESEAENMPVRALPDAVMKDGLIEVDGLPTGFMRIRRNVLERMAAAAPKFYDREENSLTPLVFERDLYGDGRRSGDIRFCMKWREMGGKLYAACELRLGHSGSWVVKDSLAAFLRRKMGVTLKYMVEQIRADKATLDLFKEARRYIQNPFAASEDVLFTATLAAKKATGHILETGSGLSTIAMAAATKERVWCIEHDPIWAAKVEQMARDAGVSNIALCTAPVKAGWYDLNELAGLPGKFALALNDGPPRTISSRMPFFAHFGDKAGILIADDADDKGYRTAIDKWCAKNARKLTMVGRAAYIERT